MDLSQKLNKRIKARKMFNRRTLSIIRWQMIRDEYIIWVLLFIALFFPVFPFARLGVGCSVLHPFRVVLDNVCYGYIAGMIFYLFSDFRPRSQKIFKSKQKLAETYRSLNTEFATIAYTMNILDDKGGVINEYKGPARRVLVKGSQDDKHSTLNEIVLSRIKSIFVLIKNEIDTLLLMYQDVLNEEELKNLNWHSHVYDKLHYSSLSEYISVNVVCVTNADLDYFIDDFYLNYNMVCRLKTQYSSYLFDSHKFEEEHPMGA